MSKVVDFATSPLGFIVGGKTGRLITAASLVVAGAISGNPQLVMAGVAMGAQALKKSPRVPQSMRDRLYANLDLTAPRKIWLGATAAPLDVRYEAFTGADQEYHHLIVALASHKATAIEDLLFGSDPAWTLAGGVATKFAGYLTVTPVLEGTSVNGIAIDSVWTTACTLTGCAYVHLRFKRSGNSKKAESPFAGGVPTRMTIRGKGAPVYDPRFDSTAGGSGAQRVGDQSTWAWSTSGVESGRNPALHALWYKIGWRINGKLAVGRGMPPARLDMASYITSANLCDEAVTKAGGGTEPRYRADFVASEGEDPSTVLGNLEAAMNGELDDSSGKIGLFVYHNDLAAPVLALGADDILGDELYKETPPLDEIDNVTRGRFTDASNAALYELVDYPEVALPGGAPDGIERVDTFDLAYVQSPSQAQRLAKQRLQRDQYQATYAATLNFRSWQLSRLKVVTLTHPTLGWTKTFRVRKIGIGMNGEVPVLLREEHASMYAWAAEEAPAVVGAVPTPYDWINNPVIGGIAEAGGTANWSGIVDDDGNLPQNKADVTANAQYVVEVPPARSYPADYLGAVTSGLPETITPKVTKGGASVRTLDSTTYAVTGTSCTVAVDNVNGNNTKGNVTVSALAAKTSHFELNVTIAGVAMPPVRTVLLKDQGSPPTPSGGGGGTTKKSDNTSSYNNITAVSSAPAALTVASMNGLVVATGEKLYGSAPLDYQTWATGNFPNGRTGSARWEYAPTGTTTWTAFGAFITGSTSTKEWEAGGEYQPAEPGHVDVTQNVSPGAGTYDVRLVAYQSSSANSSRLNFSGTATIEAKV